MGKPRSIKPNTALDNDPITTSRNEQDENVMLRGLESTLDIHTHQFEKILNAIKETKCALEAKIDTVALDVGLLRADHKKLTDRVTEVESTNAAMRPTVQQLQKEVKEMSVDILALRRRAEEAEGFSRRSNVRFVGFPEGAEGANTDIFLEDWLISTV